MTLTELINNPYLIAGSVLGFSISTIAHTLMTIIGKPNVEKRLIERKYQIKKSLISKLIKSGFKVYEPSTDPKQMDIKVALSEKELMELEFGSYVIFHESGELASQLESFSDLAQEEADFRRANFKVIKGGKHTSNNSHD